MNRFASPSPIRSTLAFSVDWGIIAASFWAIQTRHLPYFVGLILIGSRQRGLMNLVHDASHGNLFRSRWPNDFVTNVLAALPMGETVRRYREEHLRHHRFLNQGEKDPDRKKRPAFENCLYSLVGRIGDLRSTEKLFVVSWYLVITALAGIDFLFVWFISRATAYHSIRMIVQVLDHDGLPKGQRARNLPHRLPLSYLLHPHNDMYHLAHHLIPSVSHYHLPRVHKALLEDSHYANGHHCDSYLFGEHSALDCALGQCENWGTQWA